MTVVAQKSNEPAAGIDVVIHFGYSRSCRNGAETEHKGGNYREIRRYTWQRLKQLKSAVKASHE